MIHPAYQDPDARRLVAFYRTADYGEQRRVLLALADCLEEAGLGGTIGGARELDCLRYKGQWDYGVKTVLLRVEGDPEKLASLEWIDDLAYEMGLTPDCLMDHAEHYQSQWNHYKKRHPEVPDEGVPDYDWITTQMGSERWRNAFGEKAREFWAHYAVVTGEEPVAPTVNLFSCSC